MSESFDLLERPWLPVRRLDGTVEQVGLRRALVESHLIERLVGDIATQDAALLRLLLAITHRAFRETLDRPDHAGWPDLWASAELPAEPVLAYLQEHQHRFDLLDPEAPFMQVADLRTATGKESDIVVLLPDVRNNNRLFSTRAGRSLRDLETAEAARWLVTCHAFDPSGIKSGAVGDNRVKGGKGYPIGTGWAGSIGLVIVEGSTLRETLLLNLARPPHGYDSATDLPVWERPALTSAVEALRAHAPTGPVDVYTWPSRRIRLFGDQERVHSVLVCNGDALSPQNRMNQELMSGWRFSRNQAKLLKCAAVYMPRTHDPSRALWRGFSTLLVEAAAGSDKHTRPAPNLTWLAGLRNDGLLAWDTALTVRAVGMTYGSQSAIEEELVDDALPLPAALLGDAGLASREVVDYAVKQADVVGQALGQLAENLTVAAGGQGVGPRAATREQFFFNLQAPFTRWLSRVHLRDLTTAAIEWQDIVERSARDVADRILASASPASWSGRNNAQGRLVNAPLADLWFRSAVSKALPLRRDAAKHLEEST